MRVCLLILGGVATPSSKAHGLEERYDLPLPLGYVIAGVCVVVALTFLFAGRASFFKLPDATSALGSKLNQFLSKWAGPFHVAFRLLGLFLLMLAVATAILGSQDPLMNLTPTLVWVVGWTGLAFIAILLGDVWPLLDPWRTIFDGFGWLLKRFGLHRVSIHRSWPEAIGQWPAALLLLAWCWLEVIYPLSSSPLKTGYLLLVWTLASAIGMGVFGRQAWLQNADFLSIYFASLGRCALLRLVKDESQIKQEDRKSAPVPIGYKRPGSAGRSAFVMAMLATVLFDGLHGGSAWNALEPMLKRVAGEWNDANGYVVGSLGLLAVWCAIWACYRLACWLCVADLLGPDRGRILADTLCPTLIPIAAGYVVAHNFSLVVTQAPTIVPLMSDPFGWQWQLFGDLKRSAGGWVIDAQLTWYVAVVSIVLGHVVSVLRSHVIKRQLAEGSSSTPRTMVPMMILMVGYTALSMVILSEPMVNYPGSG